MTDENKATLSSVELALFREEAERKQRRYSRKRAKYYEQTNGRKILKDGDNKKGRPK